MDMFDLFKEPDPRQNSRSSDSQDSPPIPSQNESETQAYSTPSEQSVEDSPESFSTLPTSSETILNSLVVAVPGSILMKGTTLQLSWLSRLAHSVEALRGQGMKVALVVGESPDVRAAARAAQQLSLHPQEISQATRASSGLNASLVLRTLSQAHSQVCEDIPETVSIMQGDKLPVMLGAKDALSMEARAALLAENMHAKLILFSELDIPSNRFHHNRFSKMASEAAFRSNQNFIVDPLTALVLARSKIDTLLVSEKHVSKIETILSGQTNEGTWITSESASSSAAEKGEN